MAVGKEDSAKRKEKEKELKEGINTLSGPGSSPMYPEHYRYRVLGITWRTAIV